MSKPKQDSYWSRKQASSKRFGSALSRPQENFCSYLLEKRKLNLEIVVREQRKAAEINSWTMTLEDLKKLITSNPRL
jgi:hypothetical protein